MSQLQQSALAILLLCVLAPRGFSEDADPKDVFEQRIMPIFNSPDPSSCVQCHLSSVDLKDYIRPSCRETFFALRDQGLVDVDRPQESKILHLIAMGESDPDSLAQRIHAKSREAEYKAFAAWIEACCKDPELRRGSNESSLTVGPNKDLDVIRHTRKDRLLDSFIRNVWSQRMRCFPCHTPGELDLDNPMHAKPIERYEEFVSTYGARMKVFHDTPEKTLRSLLASSRKRHGRDLPLVNIDRPLESLLLLKPSAKVPPKNDNGQLGKPSSQIPVSHVGGIKMHKDDYSYKAIAAWLKDCSVTLTGGYQDTDSLPADNWYPTEHVIRIKGLPQDWPNLSTVQIFVHLWDDEAQSWSGQPIAFTQSKVTPRKIINGVLLRLASREEIDRLNVNGETLSPGKVQLRLYLDRDESLSSRPTLLLNDRPADVTCSLEAKFLKGFKNADIVEGNQLHFAQ